MPYNLPAGRKIYILPVVSIPRLRYNDRSDKKQAEEEDGSVFGYIGVHDAELRLRELDCYRGVYCGLCRAQGSCTGQCSRLTLSYDFAFMALVRTALAGDTVQLELRRCPVHPLRRRPMARINDSLRLTALSASLLAWHKLQDDRRDEDRFSGKGLRAALAMPWAASARRRALRRSVLLPCPADDPQGATDGRRLDTLIADSMSGLCELEKQAPPSVDAPAQLFGELLGGLLSYGLEGGNARIARQIGLHTGRWIYILDAADDYADDVRHGHYNPFRCLSPDGVPTLPESNRESIRLALCREAEGISDALDLLDIPDRNVSGVIRNIVDEGMPRTAKRILFPDPVSANKRRSKRYTNT